MGWAAALNVLKEEGLENRWNRCGDLAKGVRNLFLDLGFELLAEVSQRSATDSNTLPLELTMIGVLI